MSIYPRQTERESIIADAASSQGKTPEQRAAMFVDLLATIELLWANLSEEEQQRRREIHRKFHAKPEPWWKNLRREAWPKEDVVA